MLAVITVIALLAGSQTFAAQAPAEGFTAVSANMKGAVKVTAAKAYQEPSAKSAVVKTLAFGKKVDILAEKGDWYQTSAGYMTREQVVKYDKTKKHLALTFDDGPNAKTTKTVLNALEKNGCRATFFLVGRNINAKTKSLVKRQKAMGCELGNHTYSHAKLTKGGTKSQLAKTDKKVKALTGAKPTVARAPYGAINKSVLAAMGRPHIYWSVDTLDWQHRNTKTLIAKVKKQKRNGAIILMHDIHKSTANGVNSICKYLVKSGYECVTVTELAAIKGKTLKAGKNYKKF